MRKREYIKTVAYTADQHLVKIRRIIDIQKDLLQEIESEYLQVERFQQDQNVIDMHQEAINTKAIIQALETRFDELSRLISIGEYK